MSKCNSSAEGCDKAATVCHEWQTPHMSAPSFWYSCDEHAKEVRKHFSYATKRPSMGVSVHERRVAA